MRALGIVFLQQDCFPVNIAVFRIAVILVIHIKLILRLNLYGGRRQSGVGPHAAVGIIEEYFVFCQVFSTHLVAFHTLYPFDVVLF